jgi:hypothetical protein
MIRKLAWFLAATTILTLELAACVGDGAGTGNDGGTTGSNGKPCYPNKTCDTGLTCVSDVCVDLSKLDASADATTDGWSDGAAACPTNPVNLTPKTPAARAPESNQCTSAQLQAFYDACMNGGDCAGWETANATCYACLVSKQTDSSWSAVVEYSIAGGGFISLNRAYCEETQVGAQCGAKAQAQIDCTLAACAMCASNDLAQCLLSDGAATPTCSALTGCITDGAPDPCVPTTTTEQLALFNSLATHFCP